MSLAETKICKKCGVEKPLTDFRCKIRNSKEHYEHVCKFCRYEHTKENRNNDEYRASNRLYYAANKEKINARRHERYVPKVRKSKQDKSITIQKNKEWQKNNPEKRKSAINKYHETHKEQEKEYAKNNKDKINERSKIYRENNKDALNAKLNERRKDPIVNLRHKVSALVRCFLNGTKSGSVMKYLHYTIQTLKEHLEFQFEPWMNWENNGVYSAKLWDDNDPATWTWQLDHIIPHSTFNYTSMEDEEFQKCWALSNLRPLSAKQNILDGASKIRHTKRKKDHGN